MLKLFARRGGCGTSVAGPLHGGRHRRKRRALRRAPSPSATAARPPQPLSASARAAAVFAYRWLAYYARNPLPEFHASDPLPVLLPPVDGPSPALRRAGPSDSESGASQLASPCSSCCRRRPREAANPHPPFTHPYLSAAKAGGPGIGPKAFDRDREEEGRAREGLSDRKGGRGGGG